MANRKYPPFCRIIGEIEPEQTFSVESFMQCNRIEIVSESVFDTPITIPGGESVHPMSPRVEVYEQCVLDL